MGMIDITEKPVIKRFARASGRIFLSSNTLDKIRKKEIRKGDPLQASEISGINAAKQTHILIPHCHQIGLDMVDIDFRSGSEYIEAVCTVKARARTGVEMEALVGVSIALNTIWDMVKYLEKDEKGQYPGTKISEILVEEKIKEELRVK